MFSLDVVDTDIFLDMPATTQLLYFHLGMRADDDGFVSSPKRISNYIGCKEDDLKLLIAKGLVICFENGIVVIRDWKTNNYIQKDRYRPTKYTKELNSLNCNNGAYEIDENLCIQNVYKTDTQDRLGKDRLNNINYQEIINMYNDTCVSYPKVQALSEARKKAIKARLKQYTVDDFKRLFELAESSDFLKGANNRNWSANFDWLIKDTNMAKVLDGNYNTKEQLTATSQPKKEELSPEMQELYRQVAIEQLNESMGWKGDEYNEPPFE